MSEPDQRIVVVGPDGMPVPGEFQAEGDRARFPRAPIVGLIEQPDKVMRIGTMIKQLLEEVRAAPLDDASRNRLRDIHRSSIEELEEGLAPELRDELERLTLPFSRRQHP